MKGFFGAAKWQTFVPCLQEHFYLDFIFSPFSSIAAVTFLEYWKRKSASLAHHWDCMGFQEEEERPRPDFAAKAPYLEKNPITGVREPSFPQSKRYKRIAAGTALILLMVRTINERRRFQDWMVKKKCTYYKGALFSPILVTIDGERWAWKQNPPNFGLSCFS